MFFSLKLTGFFDYLDLLKIVAFDPKISDREVPLVGPYGTYYYNAFLRDLNFFRIAFISLHLKVNMSISAWNLMTTARGRI